ncbi:MAG: hypothetical protein ACT4PE_15025 [Candidatus Eiseniibacteriota bacterium]
MRALLRFATPAAVPALLLTAGCAGPRGPGALAESCLALPAARQPGGFVFALSEPVDPARAPLPRNPSEAVVYRLAYETLTDVDCLGRVVPGLAETWEVSADSLSWTFRLREGAPDAAAVRACWRETSALARKDRSLSWPGVLRRFPVEVMDFRRLEIRTTLPEPDLPALLSLPEFAVVLREDDAGPHEWPAGTRGRISDPAAPAPARRIVWEPTDESGGAAVTFDVRPGADPRDLIASGADAFLAGEHGSFLAGLGEWVVSPLPPSREYWLVSRPGSPGDSLVTALAPTDWTTAVRTPAVPLDALALGPPPEPGEAPRGPVEVLYSSEDADAAALAARAVAASGSAAAVARGVARDEYRRTLAGDADAAFLVAVSPSPASSLRHMQLGTVLGMLDGGRAVPLLATRSSAATRAGLGDIQCGMDGVVRLRLAGWSAEAAP